MKCSSSLALALSSLVVACTSSPDDPARATLVLRFDHRIGDQTVVLGADHETRYGQIVRFDELRYWVSNVAVTGPDETFEVPDSYYLVALTADSERTEIELSVPPGRWESLRFHIGVDPAPNGSLDRMAGELEPGIGMDWSWDTGYKFLRTEGSFVEGEASGRFVIHTGNDVLYKRLEAQPLPDPVVLEQNGRAELELEAELDRLFAGIELAEASEILGGTVDSPAGKAAGNYARMFSVVARNGERVRLEGTSPNLDRADDDDAIPGDATRPVLSASPIDLEGGALACDPVPGRPAESERGCFTPFVLVPDSTSPYDAGWFTFVTANDAPVRASSSGIVADVAYLEHSDLTHSDIFTVEIRGGDDAAFAVEYRGLKNLMVGEGDAVEVGQALGGAADYFDATFGAVALGVRRDQERMQRMCPTAFAEGPLSDLLEGARADSDAAWPDHARGTSCESTSLLCTAGQCESPGDFVVAHGDVDAGRRAWATACASCHGTIGEGGIGPPVCHGDGCPCLDCGDHERLATRIEFDMPPEGYCDPKCSADLAAFILAELPAP